MIIEKKIEINNCFYYIGVELKYNENKKLCKLDGSYFDCGDFSYLIENIEKNYKKSEDYDTDISYMNDVLYLYDRFPFASYIKTMSFEKDVIKQSEVISKKEIDDYVKMHNIKMGLFDGKQSVCPCLFTK